jgi:hypothetical protein
VKTIRNARRVAGVLTLAVMLAACAGRPPAPTPADAARYERQERCDAELQELYRRISHIERNAKTAEAAYIATDNERIAKKNADRLHAEMAQWEADKASYTQRCGGGGWR